MGETRIVVIEWSSSCPYSAYVKEKLLYPCSFSLESSKGRSS